MPSIRDQEIYKQVVELIGKSRRLRSNLVIKSFAGAGSSYILRSYVKLHPEVAYVDGENQELGEYSVVDTDVKTTRNYLKQTDLKQKIVFLLSSGDDYYGEAGKEIRLHSYISGVIGARSEEDTEILVKEINDKTVKDKIREIYRLSGGIGKIVKLLTVGENNQAGLEEILEDTRKSLLGYKEADLEELGIISKGMVMSELLRKVWNRNGNNFKIKINFDLSWEEDGKRGQENLTELEAKILREMMEYEGTISKEKVSDIKWGEGKYDEYSDQAINKTMRRLDQKMRVYRIKTVPKVGYLLENR